MSNVGFLWFPRVIYVIIKKNICQNVVPFDLALRRCSCIASSAVHETENNVVSVCQ